jgi:hypothetical protein
MESDQGGYDDETDDHSGVDGGGPGRLGRRAGIGRAPSSTGLAGPTKARSGIAAASTPASPRSTSPIPMASATPSRAAWSFADYTTVTAPPPGREARTPTATAASIEPQGGTATRKRAKANGWTRDLSGAVRSRVREELVHEGFALCEPAAIVPSEAAIVDAAAARGVEVLRSHRCDIDALREAAAVLLSELSAPLLHLNVTERSRVICRATSGTEGPPPAHQHTGTLEPPLRAQRARAKGWAGALRHPAPTRRELA